MPTPFTTLATGVPMSVCVAGAAQAALALPPLLAQIQVLLSGAFGLGPLKFDLVAQFNAAVGFTVAFTDPIAALKAIIAAAVQIVAALKASLAIGIPPLALQVSANLSVAAALAVKIGGINLLIDLSLGVRLAGINFLAQLQAALSLGGCNIYYWQDLPMTTVKAQIAAHNFAAAPDNLGGPSTYGVMIATATPGATGAFSFMFATP